MQRSLVKCEWCGGDRYQNELRHSKKLDCMVCPDCDADNDITLGDIEAKRRERAKDSAWNEGCGWVK